jgi:hypothetical protein
MSERHLRQVILSSFIVIPMIVFLHARRAAVPLDPINAVLDAFSSHMVVALGEGATATDRATNSYRR